MEYDMTQNLPSVPHLTTALTGPLQQLEKAIIHRQSDIEAWFRSQWLLTPPSITSSVDLRNSGFKVAPVDTNLFPAGFNNLNDDFTALCVQAAQAVLQTIMPSCRRILLIPESHTRNPHYYQSLATLQKILVRAGYHVHIGSLLENLTSAKSITLNNGDQMTLEPVVRVGDRLKVSGFEPCLIILNNDMSDGVPALLEGIEQPIHPHFNLGWASRLKSEHFRHYQEVSTEFAELINIDPWLIQPYFTNCGQVDFITREGEECVVRLSEELIVQIKQKYQEYQITQDPFIVVKADAGTYGMGILMVENSEQLRHLNRKQRNSMSTTKGSQKLSKVIIQEGVYSFETWGAEESVAEPVVYMIGQYVIGGFYRVHKGRGANENLNSPGMSFEPLAFAKACNTPEQKCDGDLQVNRFYTYGVIARLAALAAAREIKYLGE